MAGQGAENSGSDDGRMTLIGHLTELRNRLGIAIAAFLILFSVKRGSVARHNQQQHFLSGVCFFAGATGRNFA